MKMTVVMDRQVDAIPEQLTTNVGVRSTRVRPRRWMVEHLKRRRWPLMMIATIVIVSMAYSLWWNPIVHQSRDWVIPGDIWSTFRAAHWVGWGNIGGIYGTNTQLVTLPGIAVLLAPVAMVSGALGLGESVAPIFNSQPSSWLLLGPVILLLGSTCLMAFDAMADELGVSWIPAGRAQRHGGGRHLPGRDHVGSPRGLVGPDLLVVRIPGHVPRSMVTVGMAVGGGHRTPAAGHPDVPLGFRPNTQAPNAFACVFTERSLRSCFSALRS